MKQGKASRHASKHEEEGSRQMTYVPHAGLGSADSGKRERPDKARALLRTITVTINLFDKESEGKEDKDTMRM